MRPTLFAPLGPGYDRWGAVLSFGQDPRWRRFLVSRIDAAPTDTVLDVATGTTLVARELVRQKDCFVVGIDQSPEMLEEGRRRLALAAATRKVRLQEGDARNLPFEDGQFDALTFTYLLRYVEDPPAVLRELARVVKPGGTIAGLEFGVPSGDLAAALGAVDAGRPADCRPSDRRRLARGRSVPRAVDQGPLRGMAAATSSAGLAGCRDRGRAGETAQPRRRDRHVGTTDELKPAFYALERGGWRDYVTLLHPPYTLWHLSYVAVGAALAPHFHLDRMLWALAAFFLAMGVAAHALDELHGRPLKTQIPSAALVAIAVVEPGRSGRDRDRCRGRLGLGAAGVRRGRGGVVPAYNLELALHTDWGFALCWGAFPALTGYFVEAQTLRVEAVAAAGYAFALSLAQRALSTPVREARRERSTTEGTEPLERALRLLALSSTLIAVALVAARLR